MGRDPASSLSSPESTCPTAGPHSTGLGVGTLPLSFAPQEHRLPLLFSTGPKTSTLRCAPDSSQLRSPQRAEASGPSLDNALSAHLGNL